MARERYLVNIDDKPFEREEQKPMTPREKRANFWHYNKWKIFFSVIGIAVVVGVIYSEVTKVRPDYQIAFITKDTYSDTAMAQIQSAFEAKGEDLNNDGKVVIQMNSYQIVGGSSNATGDNNYNTVLAGLAKAVSDCQTGESMIFITDDASFVTLLPNVGSSFFLNYSDWSAVQDDMTDYSKIRAPYNEWKAFKDFKIKYDSQDVNEEELTENSMKNLYLSVRTLADSNLEGKENKIKYLEASKKLTERILNDN